MKRENNVIRKLPYKRDILNYDGFAWMKGQIFRGLFEIDIRVLSTFNILRNGRNNPIPSKVGTLTYEYSANTETTVRKPFRIYCPIHRRPLGQAVYNTCIAFHHRKQRNDYE